MRILTVIPISRGIAKENLTYFTPKDVPNGSIVSIPLRKRTVYGLVVGSRDATEIKSELKTLAYSIKKIENIESRTFLSSGFVKGAEKIAEYSAGSVGSVLSALIPNAILESEIDLSPAEGKKTSEAKASVVFHETLLLQSDDEERYATYRSMIREEFARSHSVFFCLPTTEDLLNAKNTLEKGIEKYTFIIHGGLAKKEISLMWQKIIKEDHPVLVISTGSFLAMPIKNLGTIVLENESSRAYKMQARPFIDIRIAAEIISKELNVRLILGDMLLRTETLWEEKRGTYADLSPLKFRSLSTSTSELVNMKTPEDMKKKEFMILGDKLKSVILESIENSEHTFLFSGRKGLYPLTLCSDCGTVVVCKNCNAPVVLYGKKDSSGKAKNLFVCHHCGERRDATELCVKCGGWRLNPLGIGTERVAEEISKINKDSKIFMMDKDHVTTHKQAVKIRDLFYNTPGSVMIGTEMALPYLNQEVENVAVVSLDSYFSIPDFQINEKIFHILLELRAVSKKNFIIQTRQDGTKIFDYAIKGNLMDFYRDEIADRKAIGYPPFTTYIKISIEGEKNSIKKEMQEIAEYLKPYELNIFDAFNPGSKTKFTIHGLISLPREKWVDKELLAKLRHLPPQCLIRIDPATLL